MNRLARSVAPVAFGAMLLLVPAVALAQSPVGASIKRLLRYVGCAFAMGMASDAAHFMAALLGCLALMPDE